MTSADGQVFDLNQILAASWQSHASKLRLTTQCC